MQGLEGGRGPPADSGRNRTRREETNDGVFDRRAGETFNGYGYTYNRTQLLCTWCRHAGLAALGARLGV